MEEEFDLGKKKFWTRPKFWIGSGLAGLLVLVFVFGGKISGENSLLGNFSVSVSQTLKDVFGFKSEKPVYEVELGGSQNKNSTSTKVLTPEGGDVSRKSVKTSASESGMTSTTRSFGKNNAKSFKNSTLEVPVATTTATSSVSRVVPSQPTIQDCDFSVSSTPSGKVLLNEVAWMGSASSSNNEWMELKNNFSGEVSLKGWQIKNSKGTIKIVFRSNEKISSGGLFLLERTDDNSVPGIPADKIYVGAMSNDGEWLKLFDQDCKVVDEVNALSGWGTFGGDNKTKQTLERNVNDFGWHTSLVKGGTPKAKNSQ
ncbi:MAG: lamin tail domain-containing protein [Candidatus Liptonbacteria bacterium]|nr:lamin tail domain-containing protein [Candidatus Liptonbacteria bacterium]